MKTQNTSMITKTQYQQKRKKIKLDTKEIKRDFCANICPSNRFCEGNSITIFLLFFWILQNLTSQGNNKKRTISGLLINLMLVQIFTISFAKCGFRSLNQHKDSKTQIQCGMLVAQCCNNQTFWHFYVYQFLFHKVNVTLGKCHKLITKILGCRDPRRKHEYLDSP